MIVAQCPNCSGDVVPAMVYCPGCGVNLRKPEPLIDEDQPTKHEQDVAGLWVILSIGLVTLIVALVITLMTHLG